MVDQKVVPVIGAVGVGAGITLGTFISEVVTRATGYTGWTKFGVKALLKTSLFGLLFFVSQRLGGMLSFGLEVASYGALGSIIPDLFDAAVEGGVIGLAEVAAVSLRSAVPSGTRRAKGTVTESSEGQEIEALL